MRRIPQSPFHVRGDPHQRLLVLAHDPDLQRARVPREVVEDVLEDLHELDAHSRHLPLDPRAHRVDDVLGVGTARPRRQEDGDVAPVELGGRDWPELGSRPAGPVYDARCLAEDRLDAQGGRVGGLERRAGRQEVVEDERPLVHLGKESRRDAQGDDRAERDQGCDSGSRDRRAAQHAPERPGVAGTQGPAPACARRQARAQQTCRHQGQNVDGEEQRDQHGRDQSQRQGREEASHETREKGQGHEHHDRRHGRPDHWGGDLAQAGAHGEVRGLAFLDPACDRLDHHDRVVDDQADGNGHPAQGHEIERLARQIDGEKRHEQRHRHREGGQDPRADVP